MTECKDQSWLFQDLGNRKVEVDFGGGYLSSDGGGLILRELERHSGLLEDFAGCFVDYRDPRYIEHSVKELVSQRIHGLVLGYEDLNDHDHLRRDPVHGLICGKSDPLGQDRILERDKGKALAAHSTLNRLELSAHGIDLRYNRTKSRYSPTTLKGCSSSGAETATASFEKAIFNSRANWSVRLNPTWQTVTRTQRNMFGELPVSRTLKNRQARE